MFNQNSGNFKSLSVNSTNTFKVYGKEFKSKAYKEKYISAPFTVEGGGVIKKDLFVGGAVQVGTGSTEIINRINTAQSIGKIDSKYNGIIIYNDSINKLQAVIGGQLTNLESNDIKGSLVWQHLGTNNITPILPSYNVCIGNTINNNNARLVIQNDSNNIGDFLHCYDSNGVLGVNITYEGDIKNFKELNNSLNTFNVTSDGIMKSVSITDGTAILSGGDLKNLNSLIVDNIVVTSVNLGLQVNGICVLEQVKINKYLNVIEGVGIGENLNVTKGVIIGENLNVSEDINAKNITASGAVQGSSIKNGIVTLSGGNVLGATHIEFGTTLMKLPISDSSSGHVLKTDGNQNIVWGEDTTQPGGTNTQVQYNNNGSLGGDSELTYDNNTQTLTTKKLSVTGDNITVSGKYISKNPNKNDWEFGTILNPSGDFFVQTSGASKGVRVPYTDTKWIPANFTGQHPCHLKNDLNNENIGLIVSTTNNIINFDNKLKPTINESLPIVEITTKEKDKRVFGVISSHEDNTSKREYDSGTWIAFNEKDLINERRTYINSVGEGSIWVSNKNGLLEGGDYIVSSTIPGYGQKQDDDLLRNYTVAKISHDCDFDLTKVKKKEIKFTTNGDGKKLHVFDENGLPTYNELNEEEYQYDTRFLKVDGSISDINNYDHVAMFVGCTYHCG